MNGRRYNWGFGGCAFLVAAVILSAMILVQGGIVSRGGKFTALPYVAALATFLIFSLIGIVLLAIWGYDRRIKRVGKRAAKWRGDIQKPPRG